LQSWGSNEIQAFTAADDYSMTGIGILPRGRPWIASAVALAIILTIGWLTYQPALSGTFLLDDFENLGGLESVSDKDSAIYFVLSGKGGPAGRPIAMASFLAQAPDWNVSATPFLRVNLFVHLLNGALLFFFLRQLAVLLNRPDPDYVALAGAAIWLLMPLLASSSLLVVQRMTTLCASFMLAGLNAYLLSRGQVERRPGTALLGMSAALVLGTLFASLTKENGALLPILVLVLESTLLQRPQQLPVGWWRAWSAAFLILPLLVVAVFLVSQVSYSENMALRRGFTAWERLLTQSQILWDYLINAFIPRPGRLGPFHDTYPVARSLLDPFTLLATGSWLALSVAAIVKRRRYPIAAFAILWYLAGHVLESTVYPLELYFEHRNYMPIIGPVFALSVALVHVGGDYRKYARGALLLLAILNAGVLFSVTSLWGDPWQAASYWQVQQPASVRAVTTLASRQLDEMGPAVAMITLEEFAARHPQHAYIRIPALTLACTTTPDFDHSSSVSTLSAALPKIAFSYTAVVMLDQLLSVVARSSCTGVVMDDVRALAETIVGNPVYSGNVYYQQLHHKLLARMARLSGDAEETLEHLTIAIDYSRDDDLNMMMVTTLVENERFDQARDYLESAKDELPWQPLRRIGSQGHLEQLADYVREAERIAETGVQRDLGGSTESD